MELIKTKKDLLCDYDFDINFVKTLIRILDKFEPWCNEELIGDNHLNSAVPKIAEVATVGHKRTYIDSDDLNRFIWSLSELLGKPITTSDLFSLIEKIKEPLVYELERLELERNNAEQST